MTATLESLSAEVAELKALLVKFLDNASREVPKRPMSPQEVAKITGKSLRTVMRWIKRGKLRAKREGEIWLIRPVDFERFLDPESEKRRQ